MKRQSGSSALAAGLLFCFAIASTAQAQDRLEEVRGLYASAAYEEVLQLFDEAPDASPQVEQYRIFCLVALGRTEEASDAIAALVEAHPEYLPDSLEASPTMRELFRVTRAQVLPRVAWRKYADARSAYQRGDREGAIKGFEELLRLIDPEAVRAEPRLEDLRLLTSGFLDLVRAAEAAPPANGAAEQRPSPPPARPELPAFAPPVAIHQELPPWNPTDNAAAQTTFRGSVRVVIRVDGTVESAEIVEPVHPQYDAVLLEAARTWRYEPARQDARAVRSEKIVQVVLRPR